jgi:hypothetical protein
VGLGVVVYLILTELGDNVGELIKLEFRAKPPVQAIIFQLEWGGHLVNFPYITLP